MPTGELASPLTVPVMSAAGAMKGALVGAGIGAAIHLSVNQMNKDIRTGRAPAGVERADKARVANEQDHVHLSDGSAINKDGSWKGGHPEGTITNAIRAWLTKWGW